MFLELSRTRDSHQAINYQFPVTSANISDISAVATLEAKSNINLNASEPVIGPGTNNHHTKC